MKRYFAVASRSMTDYSLQPRGRQIRRAATIAAVAIGLAFPMSASAAPVVSPPALAVTPAETSDLTQVRFSNQVCDAWRLQARLGNDLSRTLWRNNCRGNDDVELGRRWRRQCVEWSRFSDRRRHSNYKLYRDHCHGRDFR